jgi:aminomethyltransferase
VLPECRAASAALKPFFATSVGDYFIASTGYTGEDGYEITLPAEQAESLWRRLARPACGRVAWVPATRCASKPA